jgi:hypothetical protein
MSDSIVIVRNHSRFLSAVSGYLILVLFLSLSVFPLRRHYLIIFKIFVLNKTLGALQETVNQYKKP